MSAMNTLIQKNSGGLGLQQQAFQTITSQETDFLPYKYHNGSLTGNCICELFEFIQSIETNIFSGYCAS